MPGREQHGHVQLGLEVAGTVPLKFEFGVPRHLGCTSVVKRVGVVQEAGADRPFFGAQSAAGHGVSL